MDESNDVDGGGGVAADVNDPILIIDINNPGAAVIAIINGLSGNLSEANIQTHLTTVFLGLSSTMEADSIKINAICGLLFKQLTSQNSFSKNSVFNIMQNIFTALATASISVANTSIFFSYFCKFYNIGCMCFNDFTLTVLKNKNFDLSPKTKEGMKNLGIAIGLNAKIQELTVDQCVKQTLQWVKGYILGYAFIEFLDLKQTDFLTTCGSYFNLDLRVKVIGLVIKTMIDQKILEPITEVLTDLFCDMINAFKDARFTFCPKSLADFLMIQTQISRDQFEDLKIQVYSCLEVPALRNVYLKIEEMAEIDLSRFVINDSTAFKYTIDSSETLGQIMLLPSHPPASPLVRYKVPGSVSGPYQTPCQTFKDSFSFTVKNTVNDYSTTAVVFLAFNASNVCCV